MTVHTPTFMQPGVSDPAIQYSAQEFRQYVRAQLAIATGVAGEQGVTSGTSFTVTQRGLGANLSVDVAGGLAFVTGDDVTNQGPYQAWNDGTVNVTGWTVPGSGTFHHRLILQIEDRLNNTGFAGYSGNLLPVLDSGGGLPAEPASAITLATIDIPSGSGSITTSMINDYRQRIGPVSVQRTADLTRTHATSPTDDPVLQLLNLQGSAQYSFIGNLMYTANNSPGDMQFTWRVSSGTTMSYSAVRNNASGSFTGAFGFVQTDSPSAQGGGGSSLMAATLQGTIFTGAAPAYAVLQWSQNTDSGTGTVMKAGSFLRAMRLN
jgi:hypothetical protein